MPRDDAVGIVWKGYVVIVGSRFTTVQTADYGEVAERTSSSLCPSSD